eukprot:863892-Amphidinium_carterae.2
MMRSRSMASSNAQSSQEYWQLQHGRELMLCSGHLTSHGSRIDITQQHENNQDCTSFLHECTHCCRPC